MAAKRRKSRTPRVALVELRQLRDLKDVVEELRTEVAELRLLAEDLITLKTKRKAAAQAAHATRRRNQAAAQGDGPDPIPPRCANTGRPAPESGCWCVNCQSLIAENRPPKPLDKTEKINTLDKSGNGRPNEKDSSGEKTRPGEISQAVESVLDKSETELDKYLREGEEAALANGMCLTTHEWPPTEECDCPNCKKYNAETNNGTIVDWTLRRP